MEYNQNINITTFTNIVIYIHVYCNCKYANLSTKMITIVAFNMDSKLIVSGHFDNTIKIWDANLDNNNTSKPLLVLKEDKGKARTIDISISNESNIRVKSVKFDSDGKKVISGSSKGRIKVWDVSDVSDKKDYKHKFWVDKELCIFSLPCHHEHINSVCCSNDDKEIISGSSDKTIKQWKLTNLELSIHSTVEFHVFSELIAKWRAAAKIR